MPPDYNFSKSEKDIFNIQTWHSPIERTPYLKPGDELGSEFKPCESSPVPSDILCSLFSLLMPSTLRIFVNYIFYVHYLSINVYCRNILCLFTNGFFMVLFIFVGIWAFVFIIDVFVMVAVCTFIIPNTSKHWQN